MKILLKEVEPHVNLYRDTGTGIAWVEDGRTGCGHSPHPSIDETGSVAGMASKGYWDKNAVTVKSNGLIYNTSLYFAPSGLDKLAALHCRCGGKYCPCNLSADDLLREMAHVLVSLQKFDVDNATEIARQLVGNTDYHRMALKEYEGDGK